MPSSGALNRRATTDQRDRKHFDGDDGAKDDFRVCLNLIFVPRLDLRGSSPRDEDNPRRRFARVRVHASYKILRIAHGYRAPFTAAAAD